MRFKILMLVFITSLTFACRRADNSGEQTNCKYGAPEAIFQENQTGIASHRFKVVNNEGVEEIQFTNGVDLTLVQSGCDHIRQEFRFTLPGSPESDEPAYWIAQSIILLRMMGSFGPDYQVFSAWAQLIEAHAEEIKLTESLELQQGFYVRIDRILSANSATLVLTLSNVP